MSNRTGPGAATAQGEHVTTGKRGTKSTPSRANTPISASNPSRNPFHWTNLAASPLFCLSWGYFLPSMPLKTNDFPPRSYMGGAPYHSPTGQIRRLRQIAYLSLAARPCPPPSKSSPPSRSTPTPPNSPPSTISFFSGSVLSRSSLAFEDRKGQYQIAGRPTRSTQTAVVPQSASHRDPRPLQAGVHDGIYQLATRLLSLWLSIYQRATPLLSGLCQNDTGGRGYPHQINPYSSVPIRGRAFRPSCRMLGSNV